MLDIDISGHQVQKSYAQFRGPRNIMLDITKRCNFFCKHCYNESASYYTGDLDDESMMKIADQIIEVKPVLVCFCGGEPMVRFELVKKLAKKLTENEILVNMVSNGYLMDEKKLAELYESGMQNIQISLDSNKPEVMDYFISVYISASWYKYNWNNIFSEAYKRCGYCSKKNKPKCCGICIRKIRTASFFTNK